MGAVDTTYTFTATDTITSTKMNNIIDQTTMTNDAVVANGTIEVIGGKLRVAAGKITSNELASNSVNTDEIVNNAVTTVKIADSTSTTTGITTAKIANDAITEVKILNGNVTPAKLSQPFTLATAKASTSGTNIDFTSIPSWVKRITVLFKDVSLSTDALFRFRLGTSSGFVTADYNSVEWFIGGDVQRDSFSSDGFDVYDSDPSANRRFYGKIVFENITDNVWVANGDFASNSNYWSHTIGHVDLSGKLTRIRVTSSTGTANFDFGTINISYE
jgi:hypothetical protein